MALTEIFINGKQLVSFIARQNSLFFLIFIILLNDILFSLELSTINIEPLPLSLRQLDISK